MATYKTPGVYVEEIPSLPPSIAPVATAVPCFIGYTELHNANVPQVIATANTPTYPVKIRSMAEYVNLFGGPHSDVTIEIGDSGGHWELDALDVKPANKKHIMYYMLKMYFMNGGGPCYIVSVRKYLNGGTHVSKSLYDDAVDAAALADEPTLLVMTDTINMTAATDHYAVTVRALGQCQDLKDRFTLIDLVEESDLATTVGNFRTNIGSNYLNYGAAYLPNLKTVLNWEYTPSNIIVNINDTGLAGEPDFDGATLQTILNEVAAGTTTGIAMGKELTEYVNLQELYAAIDDEFDSLFGGRNLTLPPSAAIAGIIVATDQTRGVWKAPANVSLAGVLNPVMKFQPDELDDLNSPADGFGKAVNAIRTIRGRGHMVMGARTLQANSLEWRYVPVRRTFIFVEESIKKAMQNVVFEPNDSPTWNTVKTMIENFLNDLWQQGGLQGAKPSQAYFVKVGLGSTMDEQDILEGKMNVEVGLAVVRPAEFIVLRFSHMLQVS